MNSLLLAGGGARAAYQIGVVKAIQDYHFNTMKTVNSPFQIYSGVSAGAINAAALASYNDKPQFAISFLYKIWSKMKVEQVYETDNLSLMKTALPWIKTLIPFTKKRSIDPVFLLNNEPLKKLLELIPLSRLEELIDKGFLHGVSVTCSSYHSGQSIAFFQANENVLEWEKLRRQGIRESLTTAHLLASSSLPIIFPAQKIKGEWFGDGSMREQAPLSPSIHMDAKKILIVGTGRLSHESNSLMSKDITLPIIDKAYPSLAHIGGHILNGLFLDNIQADVDRLKRMNDIVSKVSDKSGLLVRNIDIFALNPSVKIDNIANQHVHRLPKSILKLMERIGATEKFGGTLASYLLFEENYCLELIRLGYEDAWNKRIEIYDFLNKD